jgi:uncharacterized protein YbjT (DUF2867 family)
MRNLRKVLAFGATGPIAGLVLPELVRRQSYVRAFVRRVEQREPILKRGASEVAIGDLRDATFALISAWAWAERIGLKLFEPKQGDSPEAAAIR